jgi:hypothetical protein
VIHLGSQPPNNIGCRKRIEFIPVCSTGRKGAGQDPLFVGKRKNPLIAYIAVGVLLVSLTYFFIQAKRQPGHSAPPQPVPLHDQK